jgi:hypothetical protein
MLTAVFGSGTMIMLKRSCGVGAAGSVFAITMAKDAPMAPDVNHLWPLMTHSSPSRTAVVWRFVGSAPDTSGSVMEKQERIAPSTFGWR